MALADKCLDYIRAQGHVSFVELGRILSREGVDPEGPVGLEVHPNTFLWVGSQALADVTRELRKNESVTLLPAQVLSYLLDGAVPDMPVAARPPAAGYKEPHWLPVVFHTTNQKEN